MPLPLDEARIRSLRDRGREVDAGPPPVDPHAHADEAVIKFWSLDVPGLDVSLPVGVRTWTDAEMQSIPPARRPHKAARTPNGVWHQLVTLCD